MRRQHDRRTIYGFLQGAASADGRPIFDQGRERGSGRPRLGQSRPFLPPWHLRGGLGPQQAKGNQPQRILQTDGREQADPEDGPVEIYYYWERDDLPRDAVGHNSILPVGSIEDAIEDAEIKLAGRTVRMWLTTEEGLVLQ